MKRNGGFVVSPDGTVKRARTVPMRRQTCKACKRDYATNIAKRRDAGICPFCQDTRGSLTVIK